MLESRTDDRVGAEYYHDLSLESDVPAPVVWWSASILVVDDNEQLMSCSRGSWEKQGIQWRRR